MFYDKSLFSWVIDSLFTGFFIPFIVAILISLFDFPFMLPVLAVCLFSLIIVYILVNLSYITIIDILNTFN